MVTVIGGGLAGSEAALQLGDRGYQVRLVEMRPVRTTEAHQSDRLGEIVCSNSFKSERSDTASGALKIELDLPGCRLLPIARAARVPAGAALALDREIFSTELSRQVEEHPAIELVREEVVALPEDGPCIVATGPLTSPALQASIAERLGAEALYFYDAIAPSVLLDSIDTDLAFRAARYDKGDADYINCPMSREEYEAFLDALLEAERVPLKDFEQAAYFQGCMPIEAIADGGRESLRFGPMRPVGLEDPRSGRRPWAVVQLRQETRDGTLYGLVGFQTQLKYSDQKRVFSMIPGLGSAEFVRLGSLHRNTFLDSPRHLDAGLRLLGSDQTWFAGQITGCEGYVESLASGLMAALSVDCALQARDWSPPPSTTLLGALLAYLRDASGARLSPMNVNFGLLPPLDSPPRAKRERKEAYTQRAREQMSKWREHNSWLFERSGSARR